MIIIQLAKTFRLTRFIVMSQSVLPGWLGEKLKMLVVRSIMIKYAKVLTGMEKKKGFSRCAFWCNDVVFFVQVEVPCQAWVLQHLAWDLAVLPQPPG